ncbi:hypothetical protein HOLleu_17310 [Holothuria leucospilota]|uniref:Uncharacterized protein n=1 Tax=Holothuria leucospilota TaxID=206669 RepID=A0A9Q1HB70_HOLLE|nr:hypothetical protein HOLleu_17310 [Holothuria leucospilota]
MVDHMRMNLISNKQFGFISGRSSTQQLLKVMDVWTKVLDNHHQQLPSSNCYSIEISSLRQCHM